VLIFDWWLLVLYLVRIASYHQLSGSAHCVHLLLYSINERREQNMLLLPHRTENLLFCCTIGIAFLFRRMIHGYSHKPVVVYYDSSQELHRDIQYHPEQPSRITKCLEGISALRNDVSKTSRYKNEDAMMIQLVDCAPMGLELSIGECNSQPITLNELEYAEELLLMTHQPELVLNLKHKSQNAKAQRLANGKPALGHVRETILVGVVAHQMHLSISCIYTDGLH
jgi:hypothetical protein